MHGRQQPLAPDVIPSPTPPPTPCSDNQNCFQVLPNIAWGPKCPHSGTTALDYAVSRAGDADWLEHGLKRYGHMPREPSFHSAGKARLLQRPGQKAAKS